MVQNLLMAVAIGLIEGVWLYFSLAGEERPRFNLLSRRTPAPAGILPTPQPYALREGQLA